MHSNWRELPNLDRHCFACGTENHFGLKMKFSSNGEQLRSVLSVPEHTRGWSNLVHGGILATIMDEIMSWTAIQLTHNFILTQEIKITFKKPIFIGSKITATGSLEKRDGKRVILNGRIHDDSDALCCLGNGNFVLFSPEEFAEMNIIPANFIAEMAADFGHKL